MRKWGTKSGESNGMERDSWAPHNLMTKHMYGQPAQRKNNSREGPTTRRFTSMRTSTQYAGGWWYPIKQGGLAGQNIHHTLNNRSVHNLALWTISKVVNAYFLFSFPAYAQNSIAFSIPSEYVVTHTGGTALSRTS